MQQNGYKNRVLNCAHCGVEFLATYKQAWNAEKLGTDPYCNSACRSAAQVRRLTRPRHDCGPCPTCGKNFFSLKKNKIFCSIDCYTESDQLKRQARIVGAEFARSERGELYYDELSKKMKTGQEIPCMNCASPIYVKKSLSLKKKFCSQVCYRAYLSERFDRWMATPGLIIGPQCYDEFLSAETLPCLISGCDWSGKQLTLHANEAHGIMADDFKRMAGFNLTTGVISSDLSLLLSRRYRVGVAIDRVPVKPGRKHSGYYSAERTEHIKKGRALRALLK